MKKNILRGMGFTLIELLVVIAIIAVVSIIVLVILNPTELLRQSRDSNRLSDVTTLNHALSVYLTQGGFSLGRVNTVYVSIPDPTATSSLGDQCQGLGLLFLPPGYTYQCASSSTYRNVDSTGWLPVNLSGIIGSLPVDPINISSTRRYYTYTTNGTQFEITATMESQKYGLGGTKDVIGTDGGSLATVYEKGTKLGLEPLDYGDASLTEFLSLNEGTGTVAYDYSGNNATGSWSGTQAGSNTFYSGGKIGAWAGYFNGIDDYITIPGGNNTLPSGTNVPFTIALWLSTNNLTGPFNFSSTLIMTNEVFHTSGARFSMVVCPPLCGWDIESHANGGNGGFAGTFDAQTQATDTTINAWYQIVAVYDGTTPNIYVNGVLSNHAFSPTPGTYVGNAGSIYIGGSGGTGLSYWPGLMDDIRFYKRALSAAEIQSLYGGSK